MKENDIEPTFERVNDLRTTLNEIVKIKKTDSVVRRSTNNTKMPPINVNKTIDVSFFEIDQKPFRFVT